MRISGYWVAAAWLVSTVASYFGVGWFLGIVVEGNNISLIPKGSLILPAICVPLTLILTVLWARGIGARGLGRAQGAGEPSVSGLGRRRFLVGAATTVGGLVGVGAAPFVRNAPWITITMREIFGNQTPKMAEVAKPEWKGARVVEYRRLGRTNAEVSDISLGAARIKPEANGEEIARMAIDRGVTYFDTAPDYSDTGSEIAVGRAMKGRRDQMFVATKFCTPQGDLPAGSSIEQYMEVVNASLGRLQTDYVDLVHVHSCNTIERLMDPNAHEAFDRLKQQGKVRFLGVSTHTPNLEAVANTAIDSGRFDVLMLAYHHGAWPGLPDIIDRAKAKDIGVVAMKTLKGAKHRGLIEFRDEADSYTQAAFKWVLNNPSVSCLVVSFADFQHVDEYLYASGKRPSHEDYATLDRYDQLIAGKHCYQHCGQCLSACPENLPIDDILRYRMYFEDYGDEREALRLYTKLDKNAEACLGCSAPCTGVCPYKVPIQERMTGTHRLLTLV